MSIDVAELRRWDALLTDVREAVALYDRDLRVMYASPAIEALSGYTPQELVGRRIRDMVHPDDLAELDPIHGRIAAVPWASGTARFRFLTKGGEAKWVEAHATNRLADADFHAFVATYREGASRHEAIAELREGSFHAARLLRDQRDLLRAVSVATTHEDVAQIAVDALRRLPAFDVVGVYVLEKHTGDLVLVACSGASETFLAEVSRVGKDDPRVAWLTGLDNYVGGPVLPLARGADGEHGMREGLATLTVVPVRHGARVQGCLNVASRTRRELSAAEVGVVEAVAAAIGERFVALDAERLAAQSARRHAVLFDTMDQGVVYQDATGRVVDVNPAACRMIGVRREVLLGQPDAGRTLQVHREDGTPLLPADRPSAVALRTGAACTGVTMGVTSATGETRWVAVDARPFHRPDGAVEGVLTVVTDVTERRRASAELERKVAEYDALVSASRDGYIVLDEGGVVEDADGATCRLLSLTLPQLVGRDVWSVLERDSMDRSAVVRDLGARGWARFEARVLREGSSAPVEVTCWRIPRDPRIHAFLRDLREEKRALAELLAQELRYRSILRGALDGLLLVESEGTIVDANDVLAQMLGTSTVRGADVGFYDHPDANPSLSSSLREVSRTGAGRFTTILRRANGDPVEVEVSAWNAGAHGEVFAFVRDLTARRRAERDLAESDRQLRHAQKMDALGRLAGGVAHDFNNLLTVIQTSAVLAREATQVPEVCAELDEIAAAGTRAAGLTRQLLTFSRRQVDAVEVPIELVSHLDELGRMMRRLIGEDVTLTVVRAAEELTIIADPGRIEQVIVNLLVNARDAMPTGGRVTVTCTRAVLAAGEVGDLPAGAYAQISVEDTGAGMPPETVDRVFEPFFTTKGTGGTGLGLSIVYGVVAQYRGHVRVRSESGKGTRFDVILPLAKEPSVPASARLRAALPRGSGTVLLVEDDASVLRVIRHMLVSAGYDVLACATAEEALVACERRAGRLDAILTDLVLPRMRGCQLIEQIRKAQPDLPVVCMSGYPDAGVAEDVVRASGVRFVGKPVVAAALLDALASAIRSPLLDVRGRRGDLAGA